MQNSFNIIHTLQPLTFQEIKIMFTYFLPISSFLPKVLKKCRRLSYTIQIHI